MTTQDNPAARAAFRARRSLVRQGSAEWRQAVKWVTWLMAGCLAWGFLIGLLWGMD